jgi:hypothetical protein
VALEPVYQLNTHAVCRQVDDEAVILDLDSGLYYGLNNTGTRIWQLLGDRMSVGEMLIQLVSEFEVDAERLAEDIRELLCDLVAKGLLLDTAGVADAQPAT